MNQKTIFTELMRKLFTTVLMIPAFVAVTAQTEKTRCGSNGTDREDKRL